MGHGAPSNVWMLQMWLFLHLPRKCSLHLGCFSAGPAADVGDECWECGDPGKSAKGYAYVPCVCVCVCVLLQEGSGGGRESVKISWEASQAQTVRWLTMSSFRTAVLQQGLHQVFLGIRAQVKLDVRSRAACQLPAWISACCPGF